MPHFAVAELPLLAPGVHHLTVAREWGVVAALTGRNGGVSTAPYDTLNLGGHVGDDTDHVTTNRDRVARALGRSSLTIVRQVHGRSVVWADQPVTDPTGDIVVSDGEHAVAILVADCVPLLFVSPEQHRLAVAHAGWRGIAAGVIDEALQLFRAPHDVLVIMGPSISGHAYQVGPEVVAASPDFLPCATPDGDRFRLDLRRTVANQLEARGVSSTRLHLSDEVTDGGGTFFSDRAARPCGRFALVARWA